MFREGKVAADVLLTDGFSVSSGTQGRSVDDLSELRLVPRFNERDPETFFVMFERLADARGWRDSTRTLMLQCVLTGRAQEAYSSLTSSDCLKCDLVKSAVLKAYELVPEAYRQRFRSLKRGDKSHLEFARDISTHFDRWCAAAEVDSQEALRDLIILEQFSNSVPEHITTYISERAVKTATEAAALADDYVLTHGGECPVAQGGGGHRENSSAVGAWSARPVKPVGLEQRHQHGAHESDKICNYCHKRGHWRRDCYAFKSRTKQAGASVNPKPAMFVAPVSELASGELKPQVSSPELESYLPFITEGFVSLVGSEEKVHVKILRDTGAFDSFILASTLPFSDDTYMGSFIPVLGMGLKILRVPLHKMMLFSDLFQGEVAVGVRPALPVAGITMILDNDIAVSRVWPDVAPRAIVTECKKIITVSLDRNVCLWTNTGHCTGIFGKHEWDSMQLSLKENTGQEEAGEPEAVNY